MSDGPKQANVQGTGIITGDINLSFNSIINQDKSEDGLKCRLCKCDIDFITMGGEYRIWKGQRIPYCDWCIMVINDYNEKIKEYQ